MILVLLAIWLSLAYILDAEAPWPGCSWDGEIPTQSLGDELTETLTITEKVVYDGINCTYVVTANLTVVADHIAYAASPVTFTFQPETQSLETLVVTYEYPQLTISSLASLTQYVLVTFLVNHF